MSLEFGDGDIIAYRMDSTIGQSNCFNLFHFKVKNTTVVASGLPAPVRFSFSAAAAAIIDGVSAEYSDEWKAASSNELFLVSGHAQSLWPYPASRQYHELFDPPGQGTIVSQSIPAQDAATLVRRGAAAGRDQVGRSFVSGCPELGQSNGIMTDAQVLLYNALAVAFSGSIHCSNGEYEWDLVPVLAKELPEHGGWQGIPIVDVQLSDPTLKTQRRRRPGKGV